MKPLLLATRSKYKIRLFRRLGLPFDCADPDFEECIPDQADPRDLAEAFALAKAQSLAAKYPHHVIVGADQVLAQGSRIFSKPGSVDRAVDQLSSLVGKTHTLHTAFAVYDPQKGMSQIETVPAHLSFKPHISRHFLRQMVLRDETTDCVGAYKFEKSGILLLTNLETQDPTTIEGLPLIALARVLESFGYMNALYAEEVTS